MVTGRVIKRLQWMHSLAGFGAAAISLSFLFLCTSWRGGGWRGGGSRGGGIRGGGSRGRGVRANSGSYLLSDVVYFLPCEMMDPLQMPGYTPKLHENNHTEFTCWTKAKVVLVLMSSITLYDCTYGTHNSSVHTVHTTRQYVIR